MKCRGWCKCTGSLYWMEGRHLIWEKWFCHHILHSKWSLCKLLTTRLSLRRMWCVGESLNTHQILDASKVNVNQCCKNRKGCTLQSDFGTALYPFEECFNTCGWMMRSDKMRSSHPSVAEEHTDHSQCACMIEVYCTTLSCDSDEGSAFPFPWDKGPQLHLFQLSVCRQKSLGLLFSDFLCSFGSAVV